jgi:membrane protease YdiL (CAAX protease family)
MSFNTGHTPASQPPSAELPWGILATIAWLLLSFLVSVVIGAGLYGLWQSERTVPLKLTYDGVAIAIGVLASTPVQVAVLAFAAQLKRWTPAGYFALNIPRRGEIVFAALCVIGMTAVFDLLLYVSGRDIVPQFQVEAYQSAKEAGWLLWLAIAIVFAAPIGEEIAFRGFLYRGFARPGREMLAIVVIALAWALLHVQYDWLGMTQVFTAGLMLGWFRWASGSTTLAIILHILINFTAMIETAIKMEWLS